MSKAVLYATSNPGKLEEVGRYLRLQGIHLLSPQDVGVSIDVPETGSTLEENAVLKAQAYLVHFPEHIIMSDDTGCEIEGLGGEPGIFVRRWKDHVTEMTDEEIISYCIERMQDLKGDQRKAQFRTVIAIAEAGKEVKLFDGTLPGRIVEEPIPLRMEGFPFESLLFVDEYNMMLGDMHQLPDDQKLGFLTHRERAVEKALEYIREVSQG